MRSRTIARRTFLGSVAAPLAAFGASDEDVLASVHAMEAREKLTILTDADAMWHRWRGARNQGSMSVSTAVSPDGKALCWGKEDPRETSPFLTVSSIRSGVKPIRLEGWWVGGYVISSGPDVIVAVAHLGADRGRTAKLLAFDLRSGLAVQDLTSMMPLGGPSSISGSGALVGFGTEDQFEVREIPSGDTVFKGRGSYPRLSPDGDRLAFIRDDRLFIRSLDDGSTKEFLAGTTVKGAAGWSPDGRYLLAGAWTRSLSSRKWLVALDTTSGRYAEMSALGEGDFGTHLQWISVELMTR